MFLKKREKNHRTYDNEMLVRLLQHRWEFLMLPTSLQKQSPKWKVWGSESLRPRCSAGAISGRSAPWLLAQGFSERPVVTSGLAASCSLAVPPLTREGPGRWPISLADKGSDGEQTVCGSRSPWGSDSALDCAPASPKAVPWSLLFCITSLAVARLELFLFFFFLFILELFIFFKYLFLINPKPTMGLKPMSCRLKSRPPLFQLSQLGAPTRELLSNRQTPVSVRMVPAL